jgi:hypothetical protein
MTWYGLLHIVLLLPSRVHALFTLTDDRWGKRGASLHIAVPAAAPAAVVPADADAAAVPDPTRVAA